MLQLHTQIASGTNATASAIINEVIQNFGTAMRCNEFKNKTTLKPANTTL